MKIKGKVYVLGDNITTDHILVAEYMKLNPEIEEEYYQLGSKAMSGLTDEYPPFIDESGKALYNIIIAGRNFGSGSSREHAVKALEAAGVKVIIAISFARIFYRNCLNLGKIWLLKTPDENLPKKIKTQDEIIIDINNKEVIDIKGKKISTIEPIPKQVLEIFNSGGIFNYAKKVGELNNIKLKEETDKIERKMTMTEKILAEAAGLKQTKPGDFVWVKVDKLMIHDPCAPGVIEIFYKQLGKDAKVWDKDKIIVIPDHFIYTTDQKANRNIELIRKFCKEQCITHFYDPYTEKYQGICHITLAQQGHILPGEILIGTDSHTVTGGAFGAFSTGVGNTDAAFVMATGKILLKVPEAILVNFSGKCPEYLMGKDIILGLLRDLKADGANYMAIEFTGDALENLSIDERMTICNMVVEAGAKNGIMSPNNATIKYLQKLHLKEDFTCYLPDKDAQYVKRLNYNLKELEPMIALPHSPDNVVNVSEVEGEDITRGYLGSCTGGKFDDFLAAAKILYNKKTKKIKKLKLDLYAVPATRKVLEKIIRTKIDNKSIFEILLDAGAKISCEPSCGACCGGPYDTFGRLDDNQICISSTNRNFEGRMGSKKAKIYLASPLTVVASCVAGKIIDPRKLLF